MDIDVGRFDPDTGEYDGAIFWDVQRASGSASKKETVADAKVAAPREHIAETLADRAWSLTKTEVLEVVGGNRDQARLAWQQLVDEERIHHVDMRRPEASGPKKRPLWANSHEPVPLDLGTGSPSGGVE